MVRLKNIPEQLIISLQVAGFLVSLGFLIYHHSIVEVLFGTAFGVHFAGDLLRFLKDGL